MSMTLLWGAAAVVFFIIEALTISLAGIWFAIGAVCALITALLGAPVWLQIVWFVLISVILLIATRPLAKKYVNGRRQPTNADRLLGQNVRVTERIDNIDGTGAVFADGKTWTAMSPDTVVSMNLWGFMPDLFDYAADGFVDFLKEKINVPKSEYFLPSVVSKLIESGEKRVKVMVAEDKWYGVTYKEDKDTVSAALNRMADEGLYEGI